MLITKCVNVLQILLGILEMLIFFRVILSYLMLTDRDSFNPFIRFIAVLTDPMYFIAEKLIPTNEIVFLKLSALKSFILIDLLRRCISIM